ncbi:MAG TPA: efflux RND transporter permease subunit [Arenimonas sp.]|nr:efflux RND transporter permease subunit [Arenimonas sp.]
MSLVETSVRRRVTILMVTLTVILFGAIAYRALPVNLLPDLSYPTLTVRTEYTGAAPSEIETLITEPVEEAVGVVKGLRKLSSISRTGQSDVILEFAWGTDMDRTSLEVRDKLETLRLPLEAKQPVLLRFNPSTDPIMRLVLSAKEGQGDAAAELARLRRYADDELKKQLEPVEGVAAVKVAGGLEDEIQVLIDQQKLAQLNLGIGTVIDRLRAENINISGGRIEDGSQRYLVRTINQFSGIEQMRDLLITARSSGGGSSAAQEAAEAAARVAAISGSAEALAASASAQSAASGGAAGTPGGGMAIRLRDIATVSQDHKERESIIRLDGREAVELAIYKEGDANTVSVAEEVKSAMERLRANLPADAVLTTVEDQSVFIEDALADVEFDAMLGGLLAILIIFFFLRDGWSTFVIALSLPISLIATFFFMDQFGLSLNVMSLGGLALATGLVVDDSIVVLESIAKARERGLGVLQAAIAGTQEVSMAVVASTLTTVAVFLPLVFVEGVAGQLFKDQALTIAIAILMSLIVSLTLIPMLSSLKAKAPLGFPAEAPHPEWRPENRVLKPIAGAKRGLSAIFGALLLGVFIAITTVLRFLARYVGGALAWVGTWVIKPYDWAASGYRRVLPTSLDRPGLVLGVALVAFSAAMALVPTLGLDLIPQLAQDRFEMTVKLPAGTQLRDTDAMVRKIQQAHAGDEGVRALYGVSGSGTRLDANPTESGENIGKISIVLAPGHGSDTEAAQTERLRATMQQYPGVEVKFGRPEIFSFSTPLEIELRGADLLELEKAGAKLVALMEGSDRFVDVKSTVEEGFPEIQIRFDQERAAALGLTTRQIADQVVRKVRGEVATRYSFRDRKIDVLVRAQATDRASLADIRRLIVNPESSAPVTLDSVAEVVATTGPSEIHHANQSRVAVVSSSLRYGDLGSAVQEVRDLVGDNPLGTDVSMAIGGQGEELRASINSLVFAFALAIFLVYLVMASQFESLLHPFVIMFTIPLALVGAVLALVLTGSSLSVVVFIGLILLVGIVVKNAIILIDKVNQLREAGVAKREAILRGAESRLRPIVMTTLTALLGFLPLALASGAGAEVRSPMAITVIGGLAVSTLLTLLVIPVMYNLLDRRSDESYVARRKPLDGLPAEDAAGGSHA